MEMDELSNRERRRKAGHRPAAIRWLCPKVQETGTGTSRSWDTPFNYGCISTYHWNCAPRCWIFFWDAFDKNHPFPWLMIFESVASNMLFLGFMMIMAMAVLDTIFYDFQKSTMIFIPFPCFTMFHCLNHQSPFSLVSYTIIFHVTSAPRGPRGHAIWSAGSDFRERSLGAGDAVWKSMKP